MTILEAMTEAVGGKAAVLLGTTADPQAVIDKLWALGFVVAPIVPRNADEVEAAEQRYMDGLMRP